MTYKELLESKKMGLEYLERMKESGVFTFNATEQIERTKLIISALEKQVPAEPCLWGDGYADGELVYDMYDCPNCNKSYELYYEKYDCCPRCGQRFDWAGIRLE